MTTEEEVGDRSMEERVMGTQARDVISQYKLEEARNKFPSGLSRGISSADTLILTPQNLNFLSTEQ